MSEPRLLYCPACGGFLRLDPNPPKLFYWCQNNQCGSKVTKQDLANDGQLPQPLYFKGIEAPYDDK